MNKTIALLLFLVIGFISWENSETNTGKIEIAKAYYKVLDGSDDSGIVTLLGDIIAIREVEYDYEESFSQKGYVEWLRWDSVFDPTYEILEIEQENEIVRAKISKTDKRILFLHGEPIISKEVIRFKNNKIVRVEKTYEIFNEEKWVKNRGELSSWIDQNHPELNGFLYDQTKAGGMKFLKAIELYNNKK